MFNLFCINLIGVERLSYQANPDPNTCLGVFGLSLYTTERDLREVFSRYGPLTGVNVVYDQRTGRSRGFAFVYFERIDDSKEVNPCFATCNRCALCALSSSLSLGKANPCFLMRISLAGFHSEISLKYFVQTA